MASGAIRRLAPFLELPRVDVLVTTRAAFGRAMERNLARMRVGGGRLVAIQATQHAVRADQRESGDAVIEGF